MAALRSISWVFLVVILTTIINSVAGGDGLCEMCECKKSARVADELDSIVCQTPNRKLFEDDVVWPKGVKRIGLIEFKGIISAVLPIFKCEKEIGEIKFERSNLKGVDKRALEALPNVAKFSFADNSIEKLSPDTFALNPTVTAMNFSGNKLETLPAGLFGALDKLLVIDLSFNQVQILSSELIDTLKRLSVVSLRRNSIYAIDQADTEGVLIEELDLSGNNLRFLKSKQFKSFGKLTHLHLSHNNIKDIQDDAFVELDSLISLDLSNNQLLSIELILPTALTRILFRNNVLAAWPLKEINAALSTVDLHNNTLEFIHIRGPETIHIETLILSQNHLEGFPNRLFPHLKALHLNDNKFETVPDLLGEMAPNLDVLEMTGNPIENLQFATPLTVSRLVFKHMPRLTSIARNSFEKVTGRSASLEFEPFLDLTISHCPQLTTIEEGAFDGLNFNDLDLSYNQISRFPKTLTNWTTIPGALNLQGNPLSCECADEWMMEEILNKLYEESHSQYLLGHLRCSSPAAREGIRLVHFYRHVSPFCGAVKPMKNRRMEEEKEAVAQLSGFSLGHLFASNRRGASPWLVVAVCAFTLTCLIVVGIVLQRDVNRRRRDSRRRMLFSDL